MTPKQLYGFATLLVCLSFAFLFIWTNTSHPLGIILVLCGLITGAAGHATQDTN